MGDRLRKALDVADVTNQEMADYLGVSRNTVGSYIALRSQPSKGTLRLWAMRTGCDLEWLETGKAAEGDGPDGGLAAASSGGVPTAPYVALRAAA